MGFVDFNQVVKSSLLSLVLGIQTLFLPQLIGAQSLQPTHSAPLSFCFTFSKDSVGWVGEFADYPVGSESFYELQWGREALPLPLHVDTRVLRKGLFLSGNNHSDDLFMFVKKKITGLKPTQFYALHFSAILETEIPEGAFGIGGSPGESVYVKVGASLHEPVKINKKGYYVLNIDKGNQAQGGENALVLGNLANPQVDAQNPHFAPKMFHTERPLTTQTDSKGQLWVFLGTDSGFEGPTKYYIAQVRVDLEPISLTHHKHLHAFLLLLDDFLPF